ncbi:MAG: efflux RND transporter periplasmic adaptor subunit, partial [Pirellula sp.]|nr:efflux RND transporter periplasmic adaptor subunit [Pirellula sp.]
VFRSQPTSEFDGVVARLGKQSDRETREFTVDVRALKLPETWAIGQRAEVFIETARVDDCVWIPASYLEKHSAEQGVYVHQASVAKWRPLKLGIEGHDTVQVIEGLSTGEVIIKPSQPAAKLTEGRKVLAP